MKVNYGVAHFNLLLPRIKHAFILPPVHTVYILPFTILPIYMGKFRTLLLFALLFRCSNVFHCLSAQCNISKVKYRLKHGVPSSSLDYIWCDKVQENSSKAFFLSVTTAAPAFLILLSLPLCPCLQLLTSCRRPRELSRPAILHLSARCPQALFSPQQSRSADSHSSIIPICWHTCL